LKALGLIVLLFSSSVFAGEIILENQESYIVPKGVFWKIKNINPTDCLKVCTSDIYISSEASNVQIDGLTVSGKIEVSFNTKEHAEIILHENTKIFLGDTRPKLKILEVKK